jgi:quercetin dioxygenase-like cupin family protein
MDVGAFGDREGWSEKSPYKKWQEKEGIPVYTGCFIEDTITLPLEDWHRLGGKGAYLNLGGGEESDGYIAEIPPKEALNVEHHLFEEIIYILRGKGATSIWQNGGPKQTFEWQAGSLFAIPLNAWHQHFNGSSEEPVRFLAYTNLIYTLNYYHSEDFIFNNPFTFLDRFNGDGDYFQRLGEQRGSHNWETNFVADVRTFKLDVWNAKGYGISHMRFSLGEGVLGCHIHEIPVGVYDQAHRHYPGAMVLIIEGEGYDLAWFEGEKRQRYDFKPGSIFSPFGRLYHQHFNSGNIPLKQVAMRGRGPKWRYGEMRHVLGDKMDLIRYENEDPEIRKEFEKKLDSKGVKIQLPPVEQLRSIA